MNDMDYPQRQRFLDLLERAVVVLEHSQGLGYLPPSVPRTDHHGAHWRRNFGYRPNFPPDMPIYAKMRDGTVLGPTYVSDVDWDTDMADCVTHWRPSK